LVKFIRVGTLDNPDLLPPDIHIFTGSKQPWVVLPEGTAAVVNYYKRENYWPSGSLARHKLLVEVNKPTTEGGSYAVAAPVRLDAPALVPTRAFDGQALLAITGLTRHR
jgi:hypothetical protein